MRTHTLTSGTKGEVYLTLFPFLTAPESGSCANVSHSLTESMLFRECGVLRGPQRSPPCAADLLFGEVGCAVRWHKAKHNAHEKTTSEKLFRLTSFSAKNLEKCRKPAPKLSKGFPNDVKMSPETGFSCFGGHLHFERPYTALAHISSLRGVKVATEACEKLAQKRALKKTFQMRAWISFFKKS